MVNVGTASGSQAAGTAASLAGYLEPTDLYWGHGPGRRRRLALRYRRFDTLADALTFASHMLAAESDYWIDGAGGRLSSDDIRALVRSLTTEHPSAGRSNEP